jgi:hypothetical protein
MANLLTNTTSNSVGSGFLHSGPCTVFVSKTSVF